ncbi:MAG TPA: SDR family oxidoreductase, partial [Gemmatimonadales bacterium]|nr:SDR family oxidoreductase [Gemmatimonadales bacterium]
MRLDGARVVVTGASSGIGRAIAEAVADHGGRLLLAARRAGPLNDVAGEIAGRHPGIPRPAVIALDVADPESGAALWRGAHAAFGGLDVLINNAGISVYGDTLASSVEDFRRVLAVNVLGPVSAMLAAMPHMVRQESGVIVNVASVAALHGVPFLAAYAASKAALASVTQTLRGELAGSGVRLICVYPGYTRTPIFGKEKRLGGAR